MGVLKTFLTIFEYFDRLWLQQSRRSFNRRGINQHSTNTQWLKLLLIFVTHMDEENWDCEQSFIKTQQVNSIQTENSLGLTRTQLRRYTEYYVWLTWQKQIIFTELLTDIKRKIMYLFHPMNQISCLSLTWANHCAQCPKALSSCRVTWDMLKYSAVKCLQTCSIVHRVMQGHVS